MTPPRRVDLREGDFTMARTALWLTNEEMLVLARVLGHADDADLMGSDAPTARRIEDMAMEALRPA